MRYLFIPKAEAVTYLSCGQLIRNKNFLHPKRCLDSYVLIVIVDGSLNIVQDNTSYILGPNQFLLLPCKYSALWLAGICRLFTVLLDAFSCT